MKLIKINDSHFVIVNSDGIKMRNSVYSIEGSILIGKYDKTIPNLFFETKILFSTQPLEGVLPLDLSEVKELIGEIDVEKLCKKEGYDTILGVGHIWIEGYNQCLEDNKEKKYTNEDMLTIRNQLVTMLPVGNVAAWDMIQAVSKYTKWFDEYVESLQPKTEWNVDFVDGKLKLI